MKEEIPYVGITKSTPVNEAIKLGNCPQGRDCPECQHLCKHGSGFLVDEDMPKIAKHLEVSETKLKMNYLEPVTMYNTTRWRPKLLREGNKPYGQCIFFNEHEKCTIHGVKPLQCKTSTCTYHGEPLSQWFTINFFVNPEDPHSVREWAAYLKSHPTIPGGKLHELVPDKQKLQKILTYEILK